jgi:GNAT superfamily N-acetyltransferase
MTGRGDIEK